MKVKDLFGVLLNDEDVRLYNSDNVFVWKGEFKEIPTVYCDSLIDSMYPISTINMHSFIVVNLK